MDKSNLPQDGQYAFEPGSYGNDGVFFPVITCKLALDKEGNSWQDLFTIIKKAEIHQEDSVAALAADKDLQEAMAIYDQEESDDAMALYLRDLGYEPINPMAGL